MNGIWYGKGWSASILMAVAGMVMTASAAGDDLRGKPRPEKPRIAKLGTIDCDLVEATPIVFRGRLYRFEYVRKGYKPNKTGKSYFRFIDVAGGKPTPSFAVGHDLGCATVQGDTVYVYGVKGWDTSTIYVFWSKDLKTWSFGQALDLPGWGIFNTSVCRGADGYIMAFEIGKPPEMVGRYYTTRFAKSTDLRNWQLLPEPCVFDKSRYTACPTIRFIGGYYYMIYLERRPGRTFESHIVRSRDLAQWQSSPLNPVMRFSPEDKRIANPKLTPEQRKQIAEAVNINNSDVDLCEFDGKVVIYYSWGNQSGKEHLAEAVHDGTLESFLHGFFPTTRRLWKGDVPR